MLVKLSRILFLQSSFGIFPPSVLLWLYHLFSRDCSFPLTTCLPLRELFGYFDYLGVEREEAHLAKGFGQPEDLGVTSSKSQKKAIPSVRQLQRNQVCLLATGVSLEADSP